MEQDVCKCGCDEFYSFRVASGLNQIEHWSIVCTKCGTELKIKSID